MEYIWQERMKNMSLPIYQIIQILKYQSDWIYYVIVCWLTSCTFLGDVFDKVLNKC